MSRSRYRILEPLLPQFVTCTVVGWLPIFAHVRCTMVLLDCFRFLQRNRALKLYGYVILENHLHAIVASKELAELLGDFKSFTARKIIDLLRKGGISPHTEFLKRLREPHRVGQTSQLWQAGYHPKAILDERMMRQKLDYIHFNPVKRGYVESPVHWRYSSARNYAGQKGLLDVVTGW